MNPSPEEDEAQWVAVVDHDRCMGVAQCIRVAGSAFELNAAGQSVFLGAGRATRAQLQDAADACPMTAITLERR